MKHTQMTEKYERALVFFKDILDIVVSIFVILIVAAMPFYFTDGYTRVGTNKYEFFYGATTKVGIVFLPILVIYFLLCIWRNFSKSKKKGAVQSTGLIQTLKKNVSLTDWCALGYGVILIFSYLNTDYKEMTPFGDAWKGSNGWYMGFSTQMLFLAIYFVISRFWKPKKWIMLTGILTSFEVFFLGYCNRFNIYPIEMKNSRAEFISTIGNINWFCGYMVTVFFGVLYYWWSGTEKRRWMKWLLVGYGFMGFGVLAVQGSNSGLLTLAVMSVVFYLLSARCVEKMQRFWQMMLLLGSACSVTLFLRCVFPERFQYEDALTDIITYSIVPIVFFLIALVVCIMGSIWNKQNRYPEKVFVMIGKAGIITGVTLFVLVISGIVINTLVPGSLGKLSEISFFTFDVNWGSLRGATYIAGLQSWLDQDVVRKLVGVGPDCMAMYIHGGSNQKLLGMVQEIWGTRTMLTNAHCEWLTVLINLGVLGLVAYGGMIVSAISRYIKAGKNNVIAAACGICILAYTINNIISFQQAMSTTTMFLILGIGEAYMRKEGDK